MVDVSEEKTSETTTHDDVVIGPRYTRKVRSPIDPDEWNRKSKEATEVALEIRSLERTIAPTKEKLKALKAKAESLLDDVENETEEVDRPVYDEKRFATNEVLVRDAETNEVLESRTMTAKEKQRDFEDRKKPEPAPEGEPEHLTPGEAIARARAEGAPADLEHHPA